MKRNRILFAAVVGFVLPSALAGLTPTGPFTGDLTETWESFDSYIVDPDFYRDDPTTIMGGGASISNPVMAIYEPGLADFGLGSPGFADVSDGKKGMGVNEGTGDDRNGNGVADIVVTIEFSKLVSAFGAYWGAAIVSGLYDGTIDVSAYDEFGGLIDSVTITYAGTSDDDGDGYVDLEWNGWTSDVGIKTIVYSGDFTVIDGLQANLGGGVVPAPGAALLGLIGLALAKRRA